MLSKNQVVKIRKAFEKMYVDACTVIVHQKYTKENGATGFRDEVLIENQPCQLSIESVNSESIEDAAGKIVQTVRLFIAPDLVIPSGSKIMVNHDGITTEYSLSGVPAVHAAHQEIGLELFDRWS